MLKFKPIVESVPAGDRGSGLLCGCSPCMHI